MKIVSLAPGDGLAEFIELPWTIYRDDSRWVPPLREVVFRELSETSAFARYGTCQPFVCEADGRIAGRIAAIMNPRLLGRDGSVLGQLGYFESIDDVAVSRALIDAGLEWLGAQGAREVVAPMNGGAVISTV